MPNWTNNTITTTVKVAKAIVNTYEDGSKFVDFNMILPRPASLDMTEGGITGLAITYYITDRGRLKYEDMSVARKKVVDTYFWGDHWRKDFEKKLAELPDYISRTDEEKLNQVYEHGKQYSLNCYLYGSATWYDWSVKHWGTKWNACDSYVDKFDANGVNQNATVTLSFDTAWCAPEPVFTKLCEMFPAEPISIHCEYEEGYIVEFENQHGKLEITMEDEIDFDEED